MSVKLRDRINRGNVAEAGWVGFTKDLLGVLGPTPTFVMDNVSQYLLNSGITPDNPKTRVAKPPLESAFYEMIYPWPVSPTDRESRIGAFIVTTDDERQIEETYREMLQRAGPDEQFMPDRDLKTSAHITTYIGETRERNAYLFTSSTVFFDSSGMLVNEREKTNYGDTLPVSDLTYYIMTKDREHEKDIMQSYISMLYSLLYGISFAHCRNVRPVDVVPPPKLSKKARKKYGEPLTEYKVLEIGGMTAAPAGRQVVGEQDLGSRKLHIARGHFKTFTEEKPLFGKYPGTFWWPQQVRGNAERGEVIKDYELKEPV